MYCIIITTELCATGLGYRVETTVRINATVVQGGTTWG